MIIFVIIALSVLILVHEFGHFFFAKFFGVKVEEFGIGFPPRLFSKKIGETVYSLNLLPFGGFVKIYGEDGNREKITEPEKSFVNQPIWRRSVIVLAGVLMNIILGWLVLSAVLMIGAPEHLAIADLAPDSPAQEAGLASGDIIIEAAFGGAVLKDPITTENLLNLVKEAGNQPIHLKIRRGSDIFDFNVAGRLNPPAGQGPLGVTLVNIGFPAESFLNSFIKGAAATGETLRAVTVAFINFFSTVFTDRKILESVAGPVGIFAIAAQVGSLGIVYFLQLMALISLNLAVLNLIPFPALDGGRFLFLLFEKIKGSPVSSRFQTAVNSLGFVILLVLMVFVTIRDVSRLIN